MMDNMSGWFRLLLIGMFCFCMVIGGFERGVPLMLVFCKTSANRSGKAAAFSVVSG